MKYPKVVLSFIYDFLLDWKTKNFLLRNTGKKGNSNMHLSKMTILADEVTNIYAYVYIWYTYIPMK